MTSTAVAKQLLQPVDTVALRLIVDIGTHQVVVIRQVGVEGINGHSGLLIEPRILRSRIIAEPWPQ